MATQEIEKAISNLDEKTLRESLKMLEVDDSGDKSTLAKRYQECVLNVGVKNFIHKLKPKTVQQVCKALKLSEEGGEKEQRETLEKHAEKIGIEELVKNVDDDLLKKFCETLGLDTTEREEMKKHIADEVMLTGTESLLNKLSKELLQFHASEMGLKSAGRKKDLVER